MNDKKTYPSVFDESSQRSLAAAGTAFLQNMNNRPELAAGLVLAGILTQLSILNSQLERIGDLLEARDETR